MTENIKLKVHLELTLEIPESHKEGISMMHDVLKDNILLMEGWAVRHKWNPFSRGYYFKVVQVEEVEDEGSNNGKDNQFKPPGEKEIIETGTGCVHAD